MGITWNDQADAKLLMAIIHTSTSKINYSAIAQYMGPECTACAIQHRITRIKDRAKAADPNTNTTNGTSENNESPPGVPTTPEKRKRGRPPKNAGNGVSVSKQEEEEGGSPLKKNKNKNKGPAVEPKGEDDEGGMVKVEEAWF